MKNPKPKVGDIVLVTDRLYRNNASPEKFKRNYNHAIDEEAVIFQVTPEINTVCLAFYVYSDSFSSRGARWKMLKTINDLSVSALDFTASPFRKDEILELQRLVLQNFSVGDEVYYRDAHGNITGKKGIIREKGKIKEKDTDEMIYVVEFRDKSEEYLYSFELF